MIKNVNPVERTVNTTIAQTDSPKGLKIEKMFDFTLGRGLANVIKSLS